VAAVITTAHPEELLMPQVAGITLHNFNFARLYLVIASNFVINITHYTSLSGVKSKLVLK
jgi:hypothetical protein